MKLTVLQSSDAEVNQNRRLAHPDWNDFQFDYTVFSAGETLVALVTVHVVAPNAESAMRLCRRMMGRHVTHRYGENARFELHTSPPQR